MINFKRFEKANERQIANWLHKDELGMKFLPSYTKTEDFIHLIDFNKRYLWIINSDDIPVGFFDFEIESEKKGYFVFYISPQFRRKGMGYSILQHALKLPEVRKVATLEGGVEKENTASVKTLEKAGFAYANTDADGMLMYQLQILQ